MSEVVVVSADVQRQEAWRQNTEWDRRLLIGCTPEVRDSFTVLRHLLGIGQPRFLLEGYGVDHHRQRVREGLTPALERLVEHRLLPVPAASEAVMLVQIVCDWTAQHQPQRFDEELEALLHLIKLQVKLGQITPDQRPEFTFHWVKIWWLSLVGRQMDLVLNPV